MRMTTGRATLTAVVALFLSLGSVAHAVPELQLYIEGATYDSATETWVAGGGNIRLWVLGNVSGPGNHGPISNVQLTAAHKTGEVGTITLTPTTTSLLADPSTPGAPVLNGAVGADGTVPIMSDGGALPTHGIFGAGTSFTQWGIGNFTLNDSPAGDFITSFPSTLFANKGQINAYDVVITGYSFVHFDAFNSIQGHTHAMAIKAPFSHDAEGSGTPVPEPGSVVLLGLGLVGSAVTRRRRAKR
jgi:hypothetical protein